MLYKNGVLDSNNDRCIFRTNVDVLNDCFGTNKTHYFMASYPQKRGEIFQGVNTDDNFFVWMPKFYDNSSLWDNGITADGNLIYEIAEKERTSDWVDEGKHDVNAVRLVFAKSNQKSPYQFVGAFVMANMDYCHHLYIKIASKVRLIGDPVSGVELLDDYRNDPLQTINSFNSICSYYGFNDGIKSSGDKKSVSINNMTNSRTLFLAVSSERGVDLLFEETEKLLIERLGFVCEYASINGYAYRANISFEDFDYLIKNIKLYINEENKEFVQVEDDISKKVLFCNIAYMKYYKGVTATDRPVNGGKHIKITGDGFEKYNFLQLQDKMYGFVETKHTNKVSNELHIEKIDSRYVNKDRIDNVIVLFCARDNDKETVLVGWYENATVYRNYIDITRNDEQWRYNICTNSDNAYLIPPDRRDFIVPRVKESGDVGFGQSNIWYAKEEKDKEFRDKALLYIEDMKARINKNINDDINYCNELYEIDELKETEKQILAKARIGQGDFRDKLIQRDGCCRICGLKNKNLLYASHIKPWSVCDDSHEKLDSNNGLLLCAMHDALFDKGLITFDENGSIQISESLSESDRSILDLDEDFILDMNDSMKTYMKWHYKNSLTKSNRVYHNKFGYGEIVDETKDTISISFDKESAGSVQELSKVVLKNGVMKKVF